MTPTVSRPSPSGVTREDVAAWFLRLNGFFTTECFVLHPKESGDGSVQRTDADVIGVRFPQRQEIVNGEPLPDHESFRDCRRTLFIIAEVAKSECKLNGPLKYPGRRIVHDVLHSCGFPAREVDDAASALYSTGHYDRSRRCEARVLTFGTHYSRTSLNAHKQLLWADVLGFIFDRYRTFHDSKVQHQQWPVVGSWLWPTEERESREGYVARMLDEVGSFSSRV